MNDWVVDLYSIPFQPDIIRLFSIRQMEEFGFYPFKQNGKIYLAISEKTDEEKVRSIYSDYELVMTPNHHLIYKINNIGASKLNNIRFSDIRVGQIVYNQITNIFYFVKSLTIGSNNSPIENEIILESEFYGILPIKHEWGQNYEIYPHVISSVEEFHHILKNVIRSTC